MNLLRLLTLSVAVFGLVVCSTAGEEKKPEAKMLKEGDMAPDVDLAATQIDKVLPGKKGAKTMSLKDFQGANGKNVVLFFYPKAMTKGCTIESCGFRDKVEEFAKLDTVVIGISTDTLEDQAKFTEKESLKTPLFADPDKKVTTAFGALNTTGLAKRYTFVIDKKGVVRKIYTMVTPAKHPDEVLTFIKELK